MDKMSPDAVVAAVLFLLVAVRVAGVTFPLDSDDGNELNPRSSFPAGFIHSSCLLCG
jgi:hypothetical protein